MQNREKANTKEVIFVITARGGSKRIPGKNMKTLKGKPLLFWTLNAVNKSFRKPIIYVTTDNPQIADYCKKMGANVPFLRPKSLSKDQSTSYSAVEHLLKWIKKNKSDFPNYVILLQPTSPFRTTKTIIKCTTQLLENNKCDAIVGVKMKKHSSHSLKFINKNNYLKNFYNGKEIKEVFQPNGSFYGIKTKTLLNKKTFFPSKTIPYIMNEIESIDIDDNFDWKIAKFFSNTLKVNNNAKRK